MRSAVTVFLVLLLSNTSSAHHSRAAYNSDVLTIIEGELVDVRWRNPHIVFHLRVTADDGSTSDWRMEAGSIYMLQRAGLTKSMFANGEHVKVSGHLSKSEQRDFLAMTMLFGGDYEIMTMPYAEPYWTDDRAGTRTDWTSDADRLASHSNDAGLFTVWSVPQNGGRTFTQLPFKASAVAARADWNMVDNPLTRCEQPGLPRIMTNPHPFQFVDHGDSIVILGEEFDMRRIVYMNSASTPSDAEPSNLGFSRGQWQDRTLVVRTDRINWPYFDAIGTPQSDGVKVEERFTLVDDDQRLDYEFIITDPKTINGKAVIKGYWLALGEPVEPFECLVY
ncbi:MAG: DUF6152 family protein [Woeseiaceae bacterium]